MDLMVRTTQWQFCHAVWLDPRLNSSESSSSARPVVDALGRAEVVGPAVRQHSRRCFATVVSPGFETYLDDMLGSLYANGNCQEALVVVFVLDGDEACRRVVAKYETQIVQCRSRARINPASKALLYSTALVVDADQFVCLDADMLVIGDLNPVFAALEACSEASIFACREGNATGNQRLGDAFRDTYFAEPREARAVGMTPEEENYSLVVNDGLFAASRQAMLNLDATVRAMAGATRWVDARRDVSWRNQFIFNLALARLQCGTELDGAYNLQLNSQDPQLKKEGAQLTAEWRGRAARVLHFSGSGKQKYAEWKGQYARVPDPLLGAGGEDGYADFLKALRSWVGVHGTAVLRWSFYGLSDANGATVRDTAVFPLFATLHYLVRSNGCVQVLETGTARGVSAACLASAVAHREGARVVTLDPNSYEERDTLWAGLPPHMRQCLESRQIDGLAGMAAEISAGAQYDAILLDSMHEADHVWNEFQSATRLVRPNGLILIHDPLYVHGTVGAALERIEADGFGVVRLWAADSPVREDDSLGLALIENHKRALRT